MKMINKNNILHKLFKLVGCVVIALNLISCGDGGGSGITSSNVQSSSALTIDNAGVVPLLNSASTGSLIYVHNNTSQTINNISYTIKNNSLTPDNVILWGNECTSIVAHSRCALHFTINPLSGVASQSSAVIKASNSSYSFSQILNYAQVYNNTTSGVIINSSVSLNNFGNPTAYGTLYAYAGAGSDYTLTSMVSDNPKLSFIDNYFGQSLLANNVIAFEVSANSDIDMANIRLNSMSMSSSYTSNIHVATVASSDGAILTSGLLPIINTSSTTTGSLVIINAGNTTATLGSISYPSGVTSASGSGQCGATLVQGASCSIYFTTPILDGNGTISIPYTGGAGGALAQTLTWYNSQGGGALVQMSANPSPVSVFANSGATATVVSVTNLGAYPLTGITTSATTYTGSATESIVSDTCTGVTLAYNASCSYTINISDTVVEASQQINAGISASYNNGSARTYSRILAINYTSAILPLTLYLSGTVACALKNNTSISCWGTNTNGNFGNGNAAVQLTPVQTIQPTGVSTWSNLYTDNANSCALAATGTNAGNLYCWGTGDNGRVGNGSNLDAMLPSLVVMPSGVSSWLTVSTVQGAAGACALANTGDIYCWGAGTNGQIGNGLNIDESMPTLVNKPGTVSSWTSLSYAGNTACAVANTGNIYCWGVGTTGQIGNATNASNNAPANPVVMPSGESSWNSVRIIGTTVCAIANGTIVAKDNIYCWGLGTTGQIGSGFNTSESAPRLAVRPGAETIWNTLIPYNINSSTVCAIGGTGALYCWGAGTAGQIGNGANLSVNVPTAVATTSGVTSWTMVMIGTAVCAMANTNKIYCWGGGTSGQIGDGLNVNESKPALVTLPSGVTSWSDFNVGGNFSCAIANTGDVYCWGPGSNGAMGNNTLSNSTVPTKVLLPSGNTWGNVVTNQNNSCTLSIGGTNINSIYCWGSGSRGQNGNNMPTTASPNPMSFPSGVTAWSTVIPGSSTACMLSSSGQIYCSGLGTSGQIGNGTMPIYESLPKPITLPTNPSAVSSWAAITGANITFCAIANTNRVYCWGTGTLGQLGDGLSVSESAPTLATQPGGVTAWSMISGTISVYCGIANDNHIYCWGAGSNGQIGNNDTSNALIPTQATQPGGVSSWTTLSTTNAFSCAIANTGNIYCWGTGTAGQIGNGGSINKTTPTLANMPSGESSFSVISTCSNFSCAIASSASVNNDNLYCWGLGTSGQIGNGGTANVNSPTLTSTRPSGVNSWVSVSVAGSTYACALANTGDIYCWGANSAGQMGNGTISTNVTSPTLVTKPAEVGSWASVTTSSNNFVCAVAATGTNAGRVYCWGAGGAGQIGNFASGGSNGFTSVSVPTLVNPLQ